MAVFDKRTASVLATVLIFFGVGAFLYGARQVLIVFLLAILFAYLLEPLVSRLQRWPRISRGSRTLAITEVYVILGAALAAVGFLLGPRIVHEGKTLAIALPGLINKLTSGQIAFQIGSKQGWSYDTQIRIQDFLANHSATLLHWVGSTAAWIATFVKNLIWVILVPILAIFFLKDGRAFALDALEMIERRRQKRLLAGITVDLNEMLADYIRSQLTLAALTLVAYIGVLSLLQVPYAFALGALGGFLEFIPVVGPFVGAVAIVGVAFLSAYHHVLLVILFLIAWRLLQDYFTSPRIMGGRLALHPLAVIFAVLVGAEIGGVIGVYLSIPILAALRIVWRRWQHTFHADQSNIRAA